MKQVPNPGSVEALKKGCQCPIVDNCHGRGISIKGEVVFWVNDNCSVHGSLTEIKVPKELKKKRISTCKK